MTASRLSLAALAALILPAASATAGEQYLLGPQDRLRLKVYEWRASRDEIFEWTALNDEFAIGADGSLALPFVGTVMAEGLPPDALAGVIAQRLVYQMGLGQPPDVAVEVVRFRPFYIAGHVQDPGEFPFRPGLTVLKALSIAGGLRTREEDSPRLEREVIAGRGEVSLLSLSHVSLLARHARLEAELTDDDEITFPATLVERAADSVADVLMDQERTIFEARRQGLTAQLRALDELRNFLGREAESLGKRLEFLDLEIRSVRDELESVTTLVDRGLAVAPRQLALERSLLQVQSDRLTAETAMLRVRQETSRTDISILELRSARETEVANELREVEVQLSEIGRMTDTALLLLSESQASAPRLLAMRAEAERVEPVYMIVRQAGAETIELPATETTAVEPGDTIKVEVPVPFPRGLRGTLGSALRGPAVPATPSASGEEASLRR